MYARDVERAISTIDGVRRGNVAVVDLREGPVSRFVAVVELSRSEVSPRSIARSIRSEALHATGVPISGCVFLARGQVPKTVSGKLQRFRCRELAVDPPPHATVVGL